VDLSHLRNRQSKKNFTLKVIGKTIFRNVGNQSLNDMESHTRRLESLTTSLEETQVWQDRNVKEVGGGGGARLL
jgi:hypothetical protein